MVRISRRPSPDPMGWLDVLDVLDGLERLPGGSAWTGANRPLFEALAESIPFNAGYPTGGRDDEQAWARLAERLRRMGFGPPEPPR